MIRSSRLVLAIAAFAIAAVSARAADYDLIIRHGKIIDGTGNGWYYADLAIKDTRIAAIGDLSADKAKDEIDAKGLVVAPGFIDVHTHADEDLYRIPTADNFVRDGVTTIITGNCGGSPPRIGEYLTRLKSKVGINVGVLYGHNTVLKAVKGDVAGDLTPEQTAKAKSLIAKAMEEGAVGFSTGLIYRPGTYSKTEEIIDLTKVAASYGGIYASHMRNEGMGVTSAIDEALRIGREANCRVEISHFKISSDASKKVGGSDVTIAKVTAARAAGQEVWLDQYPYTASSTTISTLLPDEFLAVGDDAARKQLDDPKVMDQVVESMRHTYEDQRGRKHMGYVVIASARKYPQYEGRNLMEIAQLMKVSKQGGKELLGGAGKAELPPVTIAEQCAAAVTLWKDGGASCVFHSMAEDDVSNIMREPLVSIASDSGVRTFGSGMPHPRGYGTNSRVLGHYVRELHNIPLEDAVRKMTSQPATAFRLKDRGLLRPGYFADITIFDPATVVDKSTFENPHQYPEGIPTVLVNGTPVLRNNEITKSLPGSPLYGPGLKVSSSTDSTSRTQ